MMKTHNIGRLFGALICISVMPTFAHGQTPIQDYVNSSAIAVAQRVWTLIREYEAGSDIAKVDVARRLTREMRALRDDPDLASALARASTILSHQAATEEKKDLALRLAREAHAAALGITDANARIVRARAASALARALVLKENYLEAITTTTAARRAFGPVEINPDPAIDELEMWDSIIRVVTPPGLSDAMRALALPQAEADALQESSDAGCRVAGQEIKRNKQIGSDPIFPVVSGLLGIGGGAVTRSAVDASGKVIRVSTTAYSPTTGFLAAAERAVWTWQYDVPAGTSEVCRSNLRTIFAFGFG